MRVAQRAALDEFGENKPQLVHINGRNECSKPLQKYTIFHIMAIILPKIINVHSFLEIFGVMLFS